MTTWLCVILSEPRYGGSSSLGKHISGEFEGWKDVCLSLRISHQLRVDVEVTQVVVIDVQKWFFLGIDLERGWRGEGDDVL